MEPSRRGRRSLFILLLGVLAGPLPAPSARAAPVEPRVLRDLEGGESAPIIIRLADQADLGAAARIGDPVARGWFVYRALSDHAARTQGPLRALLEARGAPHRAFFATNAIATRAGAKLVAELLARPDVGAIESDAENRWIDFDLESAGPVEMGPGEHGAAAVEWGAGSVRADAVWAMGYVGQGIVVAGADTGVSWNHPALLNQYRGWSGIAARHDFHWHDSIHGTMGNPCGNDAPAPCDDGGHGTHTIGTVVGDDGLDNRIGVAPGAQWIACRNMDRGFGTPARYIECMEFFLAPTDLSGANPDPSLRPHIINNSWGCPGGEGCAPTTMEGLIDNLRAAGILFVASAGNRGPNCSSINDPPGSFASTFSVGAYDRNGMIAGFSSRGPILIDDSGRMKPDLSAPGVAVRSALPGNRYGEFQGTSMASPHVAGAAALLLSAHPELAWLVDEIRMTLLASAAPAVAMPASQLCGGLTSEFIPNNSFGRGRVDAFRAVTW